MPHGIMLVLLGCCCMCISSHRGADTHHITAHLICECVNALQVHQGFLFCFDSIREQLAQALKDEFAQPPKR